MATLLFSKEELVMSLRALTNLTFAATFLILRWMMALIADGRVAHTFGRRKADGPWSRRPGH